MFQNVLNKSCRENKNTHLKFNDLFFGNGAFCEILWKNVVPAVQATDGNMAHAHCMLDNQDYTHTHTHTQNI